MESNGGMERWNGLLEWSTGLDYWSAMPTNWLCPGMRIIILMYNDCYCMSQGSLAKFNTQI